MCEKISNNQNISNGTCHYEGNIGLNAYFKNDNQQIDKAKFVLTLINRSKVPVNISKLQFLRSVVDAVLRDQYGSYFDISYGPTSQLPIFDDDVMQLVPMASMSKEFQWPRYYYGIVNMKGLMQCRFEYNPILLSSSKFKSNHKVHPANILSNAIELKYENGKIISMGSWHELSDEITNIGLKKSVKLIKIINNEINNHWCASRC
jgi:hypothetical protein